ncbi:hypothetical protein [Lysobacter fragariae]
MARIPDAFIDDRAAMTLACDAAGRAAARQWCLRVEGRRDCESPSTSRVA